MRFCEECGAELEEGAVFCENCGAKVENSVEEVTETKVEVETEEVETPEETVVQNVQESSKSKGNKALVGSLIAVIAVLVIGIGALFATGVINFSGKKEVSNTQVVDNSSTEQTQEATQPVEEQPVQEEVTPEPVVITPKPTKKPDNSYVLKNSDKKYLKNKDIKNFSKKKLRLARNELFARHGYIFKDKGLRKFFKKKAWYKPTLKPSKWSNDLFNKYEKANFELISNKENGVQVVNNFGGQYYLYEYRMASYSLTINQYSSPEGNEVGNFEISDCDGVGEYYSGTLYKTGTNKYKGQDGSIIFYFTVKAKSVSVDSEALQGYTGPLQGSYILDKRFES